MEEKEFLPENISQENNEMVLQDLAFRQKLEAGINGLILNDFDKLVWHLYRIDVSESKLKALLAENTKEDAAKIIASLIIERQLQKIKSRQEYKQDDNSLEERW
ncbi:MAG: hypothetical protein ABIY51_14620 [Ferruginibacter sp.]